MIAHRLARLDWSAIERALFATGYAHTGAVLTARECAALIAMYDNDRHFRSRVVMAQHRFGVGDYAYFAAPLPPLVAALRRHAYAHVAPIANAMATALGRDAVFPPDPEAFWRQCHANGQHKPTPLLLHYERGGYNCLHRDLYGDVVFPLQLTVFLSRPQIDYRGGAFLLVEQRPRAQSVGDALLPARGEMIVFPTRERPAAGARGYTRVQVRHGVGRITAGTRYTLGVIFHDAR